MTHETDEDLSAFMDGELPADAAAKVKAHTASCAECATRLQRLGAAGAAFRRSGERSQPAGLVEKVKNAGNRRRAKIYQAVFVAVAVVFGILVSGAMLKKFMPVAFNNVQQMITGAAGSMGSGGN